MNTSTTNPLLSRAPKALALALTLAFAAPMAVHPAFAQDGAQAAPAPVPPENTQQRDDDYREKSKRKSRGQMTMREKRDARLRQLRQSDEDGEKTEESSKFPLATREEPDARPTRNGANQLKKVQESYEKGDYAAAISLAAKVAADADANDYDKSFAYLFAGNAAGAAGDDAAAADYFGKAIAANGLDNTNHYTAMFNLAVVQYGLDRYQDALTTVDRYLSETKADTVEAQNLRGGLLIGLERYGEAAELYKQQLAAHPDNKTLLVNAVSAYQQAGNDAAATELLAQARSSGKLTDPNSYRALYVSYINADKDAEAAKIIAEGLAQGILQQGPQLAKDYMVLGQKAYYNDDMTVAVDMYQRAAPMASDGTAALNLAKIYFELGRDAEGKAAAQQALDKGLKDPAEARKLLGGG